MDGKDGPGICLMHYVYYIFFSLLILSFLPNLMQQHGLTQQVELRSSEHGLRISQDRDATIDAQALIYREHV